MKQIILAKCELANNKNGLVFLTKSCEYTESPVTRITFVDRGKDSNRSSNERLDEQNSYWSNGKSIWMRWFGIQNGLVSDPYNKEIRSLVKPNSSVTIHPDFPGFEFHDSSILEIERMITRKTFKEPNFDKVIQSKVLFEKGSKKVVLSEYEWLVYTNGVENQITEEDRDWLDSYESSSNYIVEVIDGETSTSYPTSEISLVGDYIIVTTSGEDRETIYILNGEIDTREVYSSTKWLGGEYAIKRFAEGEKYACSGRSHRGCSKDATHMVQCETDSFGCETEGRCDDHTHSLPYVCSCCKKEIKSDKKFTSPLTTVNPFPEFGKLIHMEGCDVCIDKHGYKPYFNK